MNEGGLASQTRVFTTEPWRSLGGVQYGPVENPGSILRSASTWPGTANTLTGWTEIIASTPFDACMFDLVLWGGFGTSLDSSILFDISTGAGGAEAASILIDGFPIYGRVNPYTVRIPIRIAAGTRLSFRMQAADNTVTSTPGVAVGLIRDIPNFPSGSAITAVGTINRTASTYTNISVAAVQNQRRRTWAVVGDLPLGKVIYLIPMCNISSNNAVSQHAIHDWGWIPQSGLGANTASQFPSIIVASEVVSFINSGELADLHIPTIAIPEGLNGGSLVVATDQSNSLLNKFVCFAVTA